MKAYQRLLLKMAKYNVEMRYIQGKTNVVVDALSRVCCMEPPKEDQGVTLLEVNVITNTLPASPAKLDEIWNPTSQDSQPSERCHSPRVAWVSKRMPFRPKKILEFQRRPLCWKKGLILKGHRPLTLSDLHTQMLQIIHQGHLGVEKCQLKARDCIFWLGISKDIMNMTANCPTCIQFLKR